MRRSIRWICHRWPELVGLGFAGLALNVWAQDGTAAFLVVLLAVVGCVLVLGSIGGFAGRQVTRHSRREQRQIQSGNHPMKEMER